MNLDVGARVVYMIIIFIALGIIAILGYIFYNKIKKYSRIYLHRLCKWSRSFYKKILLLNEVWALIKKQNQSHTVELVFASFIHFYKQNIDELDTLAYPEDIFPLGKMDLVNMYRWITKIRKSNFKEITKVEFKDSVNRIFYENTFWDSFDYKIKHGHLEVIAVVDYTLEHKDRKFRHKMFKLENDLYALDNEQAQWIIDRRKYLGI